MMLKIKPSQLIKLGALKRDLTIEQNNDSRGKFGYDAEFIWQLEHDLREVVNANGVPWDRVEFLSWWSMERYKALQLLAEKDEPLEIDIGG